MRVVHFRDKFSRLTETFIYDYVAELARQGVDCHVLTGIRVSEESRLFSNVHVVERPSRWNLWRLGHRSLAKFYPHTSSVWPMWQSHLGRKLEQLHPDIIHAHFGPDGVLMAPLATRLGIPLVVTFYGYDISALPRAEVWRDRYRDLWKRAAAVTVLSEEMQDAAQCLGASESQLQVIHLTRDLEKLIYRPPHAKVERFISVGRLSEKKGHLDAVKAIEQVSGEGLSPSLRIIGEGSERRVLEEYISQRGLAEHVTLVGGLSNNEVIQELHAADAFLLCSKTASNGDREGTPTVLVEAQALGLPCVSTRHSGIPEVIPPENHWLLAAEGDVADLADRVERLMRATPHEVEQIAKRGRVKIERDFNLTREVGKLREVYSKVTSA